MQEKQKPDEPSITSIEGDLFGVLIDFYKKTVKLLRTANLDDHKLAVASNRIHQLLEEIKAEIEQENASLNLSAKLAAAQEDVKRLVEKLAASSDTE
jgi:hypothetical protein